MAARSTRAAVLAVVGLSLAAVGCGGDGGDDAAEAEEPAADAAALADPIAEMRLATAEYVTDLGAAEADGYAVITPMMPDMGFHYLNADVTGFDPAAPAILVYVPTTQGWQLGAVEWVFPEEPDEAPLPGATYGEFPAACHYADGTFVPEDDESACADQSPDTDAAFTFWHPDLVTLHVWAWYPNPTGIFTPTNPLVAPYTDVPAPPA
jgi:hypothetical protein